MFEAERRKNIKHILPACGHAGVNTPRSRLRESVGERQVEWMRGIRAAFDPNGILNPGKGI